MSYWSPDNAALSPFLTVSFHSLQQAITADNVDMIVNELSNIVDMISDPADQSTKNLEVIADVFSGTTSLIASGNISVSNSVSTQNGRILLT